MEELSAVKFGSLLIGIEDTPTDITNIIEKVKPPLIYIQAKTIEPLSNKQNRFKIQINENLNCNIPIKKPVYIKNAIEYLTNNPRSSLHIYFFHGQQHNGPLISELHITEDNTKKESKIEMAAKAVMRLKKPIVQIPALRKSDGSWARSSSKQASTFVKHLH
ncbi:hypothetical protein HZH68_007691 [Vespula germanica]|uniref:Uncharacterized protein n=1 Tax=Vespula germanica TaxID=30212 RepID=A0A834K2B7_VESGE|nr:hypothetical protein HZH68_007691 [Vespula germanica]